MFRFIEKLDLIEQRIEHIDQKLQGSVRYRAVGESIIDAGQKRTLIQALLQYVQPPERQPERKRQLSHVQSLQEMAREALKRETSLSNFSYITFRDYLSSSIIPEVYITHIISLYPFIKEEYQKKIIEKVLESFFAMQTRHDAEFNMWYSLKYLYVGRPDDGSDILQFFIGDKTDPEDIIEMSVTDGETRLGVRLEYLLEKIVHPADYHESNPLFDELKTELCK